MPKVSLVPSQVVLDVNKQFVQPEQALLIKNMDNHGKDGAGKYAFTPLTASELYDPTFVLPDPGTGQNLKAGEGTSEDSTAAFILAYNPKNIHVLYRILNNRCENVFVGPELGLINDARYFAGEGRFHVKRLCLGTRERTFVMWTDARNNQRFICVEDSMATNSFDPIKFPYFAGSYDREELINLGVPTPVDCIGIKPVATDPAKQNRLSKHPWRWRIKTIDVYGRPSEHGVISDEYHQSDCFSGNIGCVDLTFDAGNPLVDKYQVEYNNDGTTEWHRHAIVDKYKKCSNEWWTREINDKDFSFDKPSNKVTYRFCPGGECVIIPNAETSRNENPLAITSESLFPIAGGIGLANNQYGRGPFSCDIKDGISFEVELPDTTQPDNLKTRNITIWVPVVNPFQLTSQGVWKFNGNTVFGGVGQIDTGLTNGLIVEDGVGGEYGQVLPADQGGFIGYLAGTKFAAISRQYVAVRQSSFSPISEWRENGVATDKYNILGNTWIQKFEFKNVPADKYVFRIAGHASMLTDANYQATSTYVAGTGGLMAGSTLEPKMGVDDEYREIYIDVCDKDYDSFTAGRFLQIWDLTNPYAAYRNKPKTSVVAGYIHETRDSGGLPVVPIEMAQLEVLHADINRRVYVTDHNGFYFCAALDSDFDLVIYLRKNCDWVFDRSTVKQTHGLKVYGWVAKEKWSDYVDQKCNRVYARGKIVDCKTGAGVPNMVIGITRGQFVVSDEAGNYEIVVRDRRPDPRFDSIVFMGGTSSCRLLTCAGGSCFPVIAYSQPDCAGGCNERSVLYGDFLVSIAGDGLQGLQLGGRYACAVNGGDWMDRQNFAQVKPEWHLDIPTPNQMGTFRYPRIKWTIKAGTVFPLWMKRLHLRISQNLAYKDFLTWVVDRVTFVDNSGLENLVAPTQIRIYYGSLNEYNKQHQFRTNSTWQIVDENDSVEVKDEVQFVANGDGVLFPKVITERVRFDKDGAYFQVNYNSDLKDLKEGALMKFTRAGTCNSAEIFYELCKSVKIVNGIAQENSGYLNAYDSFYLNRQIPTPLVTIKKEAQQVLGSTNPILYETVEVSETTNIIKPYAWLFEHHSPSDLWGDHVNNRGRETISNPLESIICRENEIALSGVLGVNGLTNYLHYFDDARKVSFDDLAMGGITAAIRQSNELLCICRNDWFRVPYDDNSIMLGSDGRAVVKTAEKQLGRPVDKIGQNYGCMSADVNTISFCEGVVVWFDRNHIALVKCNFSSAVDMSEALTKEGPVPLYQSFLRKKIKSIVNSKERRYLHGKYNHKDGQYYLTDFNLDKPSYMNIGTSGLEYDGSETIAVDVASGELRKSCSFTPEGFASLEGDVNDEQFFSFKEGLPWAHHRLVSTLFNTFFGQPCDWALRLVVSSEVTTPKAYLSMEFYCNQVRAWAPLVLTESGQLSKLPRNWFRRGQKFWVVPFLCDQNTDHDKIMGKSTTTNAVTDGDHLRGRWLDVLLVADPDTRTDYFELTGIEVNVIEAKGGGHGK